jgi:patatin-like phospholipase/acyl hydrolase
MVQAMIDGGMIANNPAIYAYQMPMYFNHKKTKVKSKDIKMMSIAAGVVPNKNKITHAS